MKKLLGPVLVAIMVAGCAAPDIGSNPDAFSLEPGKAAHLRGPQALVFKNAYQREARRPFGVGMGTTLEVDQKQLTDTAIAMLTRAVEKQSIKAVAQGEKSITLQVRVEDGSARRRALSPVTVITAKVLLDAQFGDGTGTTLAADNNSPAGAQRAFDGAVMFALEKLLVDPKFVAYVNTAGPDPLKPAVSAPPTVAVAVAPVAVSAAVIAAPPAASVASSSRYPQVGDTWTYELFQRGYNVKAGRRMYVVKVVYSSEAKISDQVSLAGGPPSESDHAKGRYLVTQVVSILSPYLTVFEEPSAGAALRDIVTSADAGCRGREHCEVSGRVVGKEIVRVRAGEFEAIKVSVSQAWRSPSGLQASNTDPRRELTGWYVPAVKRFVKFSSKPTMGNAPDFDLELVRYELK